MKKVLAVFLGLSLVCMSLYAEKRPVESEPGTHIPDNPHDKPEPPKKKPHDDHDHDHHKPSHKNPYEPIKKPSHNHNSNKVTHHDETLAEFMFDLLVELSIENNLRATYDFYPYATSDKYIQFFNYQPSSYPQRFCRFDFSASSIYSPKSMMICPDFRLDGYLFKFFGPIFENTNFVDFGNNNFYKGNFKLGMELACFQTFFCSLSWNFQWVHYYGGQSSYSRNLNGFNYGFIIKSYPVNPMVLEYRLNVSDFYDYTKYSSYDVCDPEYVVESYLEVGVMLGCPLEIFGAWRYVRDGILQSKEHTFALGVKYFF